MKDIRRNTMLLNKCYFFKPGQLPPREWKCPCKTCQTYWKAIDLFKSTDKSWAECVTQSGEIELL